MPRFSENEVLVRVMVSRKRREGELADASLTNKKQATAREATLTSVRRRISREGTAASAGKNVERPMLLMNSQSQSEQTSGSMQRRRGRPSEGRIARGREATSESQVQPFVFRSRSISGCPPSFASKLKLGRHAFEKRCHSTERAGEAGWTRRAEGRCGSVASASPAVTAMLLLRPA